MTTVIDIRPDHLEIVQDILREHLPPDVKVWVFGSRANWTTKDSSDLDLALERSGKIDRKVKGALMDAFEDSDLPYTVDVVDMSQLSDIFKEVVKGQRTRLSLEDTPPTLALGDVAVIVMGQSPSGDTVSTECGMPLLNGPTEFGNHHPIPVQYTTDPRRRSQKGDILFCVRGSTTGRMNWADREYAVGRGIAAIRHKQDSTLQPFVRAVIEYGLSELLVQATGSTFPNVSANQLRQLSYPNLSLERQCSISQVLGTLDDKIELNRGMNRTLEEMARAIFKDWFTDFGPTRAKIEGREPYLPAEVWELFPDCLVSSELGEIPEGWSVRTLGDLCEKPQYGYTASAKDDPVGPHLLRITDINKNSWIDWSSVPYCEIMDASYDKYRLNKGDVLIARMAAPGYGVVIEEALEAVFASYLIRFRLKIGCHERLIQYWIHSPNYWELVSGRSAGTTRSSLNAKVLRSFPLVVPPDSIATSFTKIVDDLRSRVIANASESRILADLRNTMLPKLISGDVSIGSGYWNRATSQADSVP